MPFSEVNACEVDILVVARLYHDIVTCLCLFDEFSVLIKKVVPAIRIRGVYRIVVTIGIRTDAIIFLRQRVWHHPACQRGVIHSRAIVVPVKAVRTVKLLAVVLVALRGREVLALTHQATKGIVMVHLLHLAALAQNYTVVAKVVLYVIVIGR